MTGRIDSSIKMQTPEGIEYVLFPAGIPVRACAWGIDCTIRGGVLIALLIVSAFTDRMLGIWFYSILSFVLNWFYYVVFEMVWNGQSPGKRIMGIRVVGGDGAPVKPGASFLRNLLRFADGFFYLYLIAFISIAASSGFRRFGDWAADTLVIYTARSRLPGRFTPPALLRQEQVPWLAEVPAVVPLKKLSYEEKQGLLMFARRYPLLGKKRADEIARSWAAQLREDTHVPHDESDKNEAGLRLEISASQYLLGIARTISGTDMRSALSVGEPNLEGSTTDRRSALSTGEPNLEGSTTDRRSALSTGEPNLEGSTTDRRSADV